MFKGMHSHWSPGTLLIVMLVLALGSLPTALAAPPDQTPPEQAPTPYYSVTAITLNNGTQLDRITINGPATPPPGYEEERKPVALPAPDQALAANSLPVPTYSWIFGCSAVSASMIGAYFDRNGLPNIYTGPTDGGVMPMNNSVWPTWKDSAGATYPGNPLTASRLGSDGRTTRGSIDDYWVSYGSNASDPYLTGGWAQHAWSDAFGDYMKTSQSAYGNTDGATTFYNWTSSSAPLTCADMVSYGIADDDGTYGRKLFYEARGYQVTDCYSQKTDNTITGGYSFAQFKASIDAGYPVFLNLAGHSVVGVGYLDPSTVYINDTWDFSTHSMTWGSAYAGMALQSVSIVNAGGQAPLPAISINNVSVTEGTAGTVDMTFTVSLSTAATGALSVDWTTANGTATAGEDYVAASGTVNFTTGQTSQPLTVQVNGDTAIEPNETFTVNLANPVGATLADSEGVGTIVNDDQLAQTLHVGDLDGSKTVKKTWTATVTIAVHDAGEQIVSSATVSARWDDNTTVTCRTGRTGTCKVSKSNIPLTQTSVTLAVQGISKAGYTYDPTANHDPDGDSNGTAITINK